MKSKLMAVVFATSLFVAVPSFAEDTPPVNPPAEKTCTDNGWGISSIVNSVLSAPSELHSTYPKITGTLALAVVAIIAYNLGKDNDEKEVNRASDLI